MREVSTHIEQLLLHHDCVIVPGLGGFVAQDCPATYIAEEEVFLPPYRNVSFNPRLTMNDGLLAQRIAQDCNIPYAEALLFLESEVEECRRVLDAKGCFTICGVGTLHTSVGSTYEFTPLPCGILSPRHYGLDSVFAATITSEKKKNKVKEQEEKPDSLTLHIRMDYLRYAAIAAVLTLFYFIRIPLGTAIEIETSEAGIFHQVTALFEIAKDSVKKTVGPAENVRTSSEKSAGQTAKNVADKGKQSLQQTANIRQESAVTEEVGETGTQGIKATSTQIQQEKTESAVPQPAFTIVLASAVSHKGAEDLVNRMQEFGDHSAREYCHRKMTRVIYGTFSSQEAAQAALREARSKDKTFAEAWVMELKS